MVTKDGNGHGENGRGMGRDQSLINDVNRLSEYVDTVTEKVESLRGDIAGNSLVIHTRADRIEVRLSEVEQALGRKLDHLTGQFAALEVAVKRLINAQPAAAGDAGGA